MVFYRKYRPQTLSDLIGQSHIKQTLSKAFEAEKLSHAYLFCGPRGSGKTSTARILAKMVNCLSKSSAVSLQSSAESRELKADSIVPCNSCASCLSITDGSSLDLIEIDAASNRGIDDIRTLREGVKLAPANSKKKVYIIDEVHMLTTEAFNALLKTLEEPPAHVLFILATTESHKIPVTILSRVQRLDFNLATTEELIEGLKKVAKAEKIEIEEEALKLLAQKSEGGFRDSLKFLDQFSSQGEKITREIVEQSLKAGSSEDILKLLNILAKKDSKAGLLFIQEILDKGVNLKEFVSSFLETLRQILFVKNGISEGVKEEIINFAESVTLSDVTNWIESISESTEKMKYASIQSLPFEVAIVDVTNESKESDESKVKKHLTPLTQAESLDSSDSIKETRELVSPVKLAQNTDDVVLEAVPAPSNSPDILTIKDKWNYILETIKPYNYSLEALLKQAKLISCDDGMVILEVPYSFHQRILEAPKSRGLLESVLSDVLGKSTKVSTILGKRPVRIEEIANVEIAQDDEIVKIAAEIFNS